MIENLFEEYHTPAVSVLWASYSSPDQEPGPSNHYPQRSKSMTIDFKTKRVDTEELKIDLTLFGDNKEKDREKEDYPDTPRTSNSGFSHIEDPSRPRLNPFFNPLEERHETTRVHLSTNPKSTEQSIHSYSIQPVYVHVLEPINSPTHEPIKRQSTDKN
ncbi:unnamed protein product [Mytilus coruscus]|uniref:Uncharacterized protein n=1 Tax=Mytilus coruscus TaxID=42192 RepID=A0A6J8CNR3_MYTCO|nr:unnamed protein product [Mytilus coruscus]